MEQASGGPLPWPFAWHTSVNLVASKKEELLAAALAALGEIGSIGAMYAIGAACGGAASAPGDHPPSSAFDLPHL